MQIELQQLFPLALKERLQHSVSDIWNRNLVFNQPEFIKIEAPSGTGKTTFAHFLYGQRNDYSGRILFDGIDQKNIKEEAVADIRQKKMSVVFQDLKLFPHLTVLENIDIKRQLFPDACSVDEVKDMAGRLGIMNLLNQQAGTCSYGEQQRVAIIRSLVQPFEWILMDEPFSHLDQNNTSKAASLIGEICHRKNAGLMITGLNEDAYFNYHRKLLL